MHTIYQGTIMKRSQCANLQGRNASNDNGNANAAKQLEQKVRELDATTCYLHHILRHIAQGMLFIHFSGVIIGYNHAAEKILQKAAIDVLFCPYTDHFTDHAFGFSMQEALKNHTLPPDRLLVDYPHQGPHQVPHQGALCMLEIEGCCVKHQVSHPLPTTRAEDLDFTEGILLLFRDVTQQEAEREQEERNLRLRQLGEMVSSIAHEIRNPLGGIKGFASLLVRDLATEPHLQKMAHYILEGANHLNRLIDTMLRYARPLTLVKQPMDLVVFLLDFLYHVRMDSALQHVEYAVDFTEGSLYCNIDTGLLHAALLNLITNAVQAMPQGGTISVSLHKQEERAVIVITDTGEGIAEEHLEKIFQPFFTTKTTGSGFGLSETLKIVQAHQGTLEVESHVGQGSTFRLEIPLIPKEPS